MTDKNEEKINKTIDEILTKLKEVETWSIVDEGLIAYAEIPKIRLLIEELRKNNILKNNANETIIRAGDTFLKITKEGKIQLATDKGIAHLRNKDGTDFTTTSTSLVDVGSLSGDQDLEIMTSDNQIVILNAIRDIAIKLESQQKQFNKLLSMISKMYQDGEINKDTFNKLDEFLKPYFDDSNLAQDY